MFLKFFSLFILSSSFAYADIYKLPIENTGWSLLPHNDVVEHDKNTFYFSLMDNKTPLITNNVEFIFPLESDLSISFKKDGSDFYKELLSLGETSISLKEHVSEKGIVSFKYIDILKDEFSHVSKNGAVSEYVVNKSLDWKPDNPGICVKEYFDPIRYNNKDLNPELIVCHMAKLK